MFQSLIRVNIRLATPAESELLAERNHDFKKTQPAFMHQPAPLFINYAAEDSGIVSSGINAILFHWGMLIIDILFVEEDHRGKHFSLLINLHHSIVWTSPGE